MACQPTLTTARLILRPFTVLDAPAVRLLAGDERIAATTLNIPHPYEAGMAEAWINTHQEAFALGRAATFAIVRRCDEALAGAIGLGISPEHGRAELGYWIGVRYWRRGYCTEAAREVLAFGFQQLGLYRIHSCHFARNTASGRVMQKIGMQREGMQRGHVRKDDRHEDLVLYGILSQEWESLAPDER